MPEELVTVTTHKRRKRQPKPPLTLWQRLKALFSTRPASLAPVPRAPRKPRQPRTVPPVAPPVAEPESH